MSDGKGIPAGSTTCAVRLFFGYFWLFLVIFGYFRMGN
jgi:hypothetical protein